MKTPFSRRKFLLGSTATTLFSAFPKQDYSGKISGGSKSQSSPVLEFELVSDKQYKEPFEDLQLDVQVTAPDGSKQLIPAFWCGGSRWKWRYFSPKAGLYRYETVASDTANSKLHGIRGEFQVAEYTGRNSLFRQGALRVSKNKRYLETEQGTPFFWLGDTWWMGLTQRLSWPADFKKLAADRREKGFSVIQLVAGLYPDMDSFDPRGKNEAGFPWEADYRRINPAWWDLADKRIEHLVASELLPCIVGCWGYYLKKLGKKKMQAHWRTIIARWGAYPVLWCLAGEGSMPWYLSKSHSKDRAELEQGWTEMARYVRQIDPFRRLITIHPSRSSRDIVRDSSLLDINMLQTGHHDYRSIPNTLARVSEAYKQKPVMPVIESEVCYEGIMTSCRQDMQRFMFWSTILNGCCGFTYGANGIWQVNQQNKPYGPSPHGRAWGNTPWQEAMNYPGGKQIGIGAQVLRSLPWHQIEPHPEWVEPHWNKKGYQNPSAAGIPGKLRIIYTPALWNPPRLVHLEKGVAYKMRLINPSSGEVTEIGLIQADKNGQHQPKFFPEQRDWVIILERS